LMADETAFHSAELEVFARSNYGDRFDPRPSIVKPASRRFW